MTTSRILISILLLLFVAVPSTRADDPCFDPEEQKSTKAKMAAIAKAEQGGKPAELFFVYRDVANDYCAPKAAQAKAKASLPKVGRDLAKTAEAKGLLYSKDPIAPDGRVSAFAWLEAIQEFAEADRVLLKAVRNKPEDIELFKAAWNIDQLSGKRTYNNPKTHAEETYKAPASHRQALQKIASDNAARLMKAEEKDAEGLSGSSMANLPAAVMASMKKLEQASAWMAFLPERDKAAKARAEQRGDAIMKRGDPGFTGTHAVRYYEFAGSPKAKQIQAKTEQQQKEMAKSAGKMKDMISEKDEAEQKKFKKGQKDLEKELGF